MDMRTTTAPGSEPEKLSSTEAEIRALSAHKRFSWFSEEAAKDPMAPFLNNTQDVADGIALVLNMVISAEVARTAVRDGSDAVPAINASESETLLRFAMAAAQNLASETEEQIARINNRVWEAGQVGARIGGFEKGVQ